MSVAQLSADELGTFAAIATRRNLMPFADACRAAAVCSMANAQAWADRYSDRIDPVSMEDIELVALRCLANDLLLGHFGPVAYNCRPLPTYVQEMETACREWQEGERSRIERQAENDAAFADVGPLPILTAADIPPTSQRVIYAEFRVDESDSQSDYFGHRTARRVVLGFANGKREDFRQLRKCAATFEPTKDMGPGCDIYTVVVEFAHEVNTSSGYHREGERSSWHRDEGNGRQFTTLDEVSAFHASAGALGSCWMDNMAVEAHFRWSFREESLEHRENYSMGGGNYLGASRNGGWIVRSTCPQEAVGMEWHDNGAAPPKSRKAAVPSVRRAEKIDSEPRFDECCEPFRVSMTNLATVCGKPVEFVWTLWREYSEQCRCSDQSAVMQEFITWNSAKLLPATHPLSVALPTLADCYAQNV